MGDVVTAGLLPTPGNPFVARYWLRNHRTWSDEIDRLIVFVNGPDSDEAAGLFRDAGAEVHQQPFRAGHGEALRWLVEHTTADTLVLLEDDAYVRRPGAIRAHLERAFEGEVIGSPRGGMHPLVEVAARERWGEVISPDGSYGHGLWPCFLFVRRDVLLATDLGFEARWWQAGEPVKGLGYVPPIPVDTDTMTSVAFQLRDRGPITSVGQWKELGQKRIVESAPWFHAGGLSNTDKLPREGCGNTLEGRDWAHRAWWWNRTGYSDFARRVVETGGLQDEYRAWGPIIEPWINWDE